MSRTNFCRVIWLFLTRFVLPGTVAAAIVVGIGWFRNPSHHVAEAILERRMDKMSSGDDFEDLRISMVSKLRRALEHDLRGQEAIRRVIDDLQLLPGLSVAIDGTPTKDGQRAIEELTESISEKIAVRYRTQSNEIDHIVVSYRSDHRDLAQRLVNRLITNYINRTRADLNDTLLRQKRFFEREVARYRSRVTELETKALKFEMDNPPLLLDNPGGIQPRLADLRRQIETIKHELKVTLEKRQSLNDWVQEQPEYLDKRGPEGQQLVNAERNAALREVEKLTATILALERKREEVVMTRENLESLSQNFFTVRNEYKRLKRELDEAVNSLRFWDKNLRATTLQLAQEVGQGGLRLSLIEKARWIAIRPDRTELLKLAIKTGSAVGLLVLLTQAIVIIESLARPS